MNIFQRLFSKTEIRPGQRWTHKPGNPFTVAGIATVEEVQDGWVKWTQTWAYPSSIVPRPSVSDNDKISVFRSRFPILLED